MYSKFFRSATVAAITFSSWSNALPTKDVLTQTRSLSKRDWPSFAEWDFNLPNANEQYQAILTAWPDAVLMATLVHLKADPGRWPTIVDHYFNEDDLKNVEDVFKGLVGTSDEHPEENPDGNGSPYFSGIVLTNHKYNEDPDPCEDEPNKYVAWLANAADGSNNAVMRLCDSAFGISGLGKTCEELGDTVSGKMSSLAGVILHEMTHFDAIGKIATGGPIVDFEDPGYGPLNTRKMREDQSTVPQSNADSYRWFAQEYYYSATCVQDFGYPTSNDDDLGGGQL